MKMLSYKLGRCWSEGLAPAIFLFFALQSCHSVKNVSKSNNQPSPEFCDCKYYQAMANREYEQLIKTDTLGRWTESIGANNNKSVRPLFRSHWTHKPRRNINKVRKLSRGHSSWKLLFKKDISACPDF